MVVPQKDQPQVLVARQPKVPFCRTMVETTELEFLDVGRQKRLKNPGEKLYTPLMV